jgi:hypothetical protein
MNMQGVTRLALLGVCLAIWTGCSRSTGRQSLEGIVTFDSAPLADGSIVFLPQADTKSPTSGGDIAQGRFSIASSGGTACGTFRVEITALRKTGKKVKDPQLNKWIDETEQFVPARYNRQSELTATVTEQGPNRFQFAITSK